jgi:WD domain, G-beta repeat
MASAQSPDLSHLASCGDNGVRVWLSDGTMIPQTKTLSAPTSSVRWFPSGKLLAAATRAGGVAFYLHDTFSFLSELPPADQSALSPITALDVSTGSRFLATGAEDGALIVWDMKTRSVESSFRESASITAVSFQRTPDSRYIACASGASVSLYSRASGRLVNRFPVSQLSLAFSQATNVTAMAFSPFRINILVAADDTGCVTAWDISRAKPLATASAAVPEDVPVYARFATLGRVPATDLAFSPDQAGHFAFCIVGLDKKIRLFSLESRRLVYSITASDPLTAVAFAPNALSIAVGTSTGSIVLYNLIEKDCRFVHVLASQIPAAASLCLNLPASTSAVRGLHFQPMSHSGATPPPRSMSAGTTRNGQDSSSLRALTAGSASSASLRAATRSGSGANATAAMDMPPPSLSATHSQPLLPSHAAPRPPSSLTDPHRPRTPENLYHAARNIAPRDSDIFSPLITKTKPGSFPCRSGDGNAVSAIASKMTETPKTPILPGHPAFELPPSTVPGRMTDIFPSHLLPLGGVAAVAVGNDLDANDGDANAVHIAASEDERGANIADLDGTTDLDGASTDEDYADALAPEQADDEEIVARADSFGSKGYSATLSTRSHTDSYENFGQSRVPDDCERDYELEPSSLPAVAMSAIPYRRLVTVKANRSASELVSSGGKRLPPRVPRSRSSSDAVAGVRLSKPVQIQSPHTIYSPAAPEEISTQGPVSVKVDAPDAGDKSILQQRPSDLGPAVSCPVPAREIILNEKPVLFASEEAIRKAVAEEVDVLRADLRSDVLNLHRELVNSSTQLEEAMRQKLTGRDSRVAELELEIKRLRAENKKLRSAGCDRTTSAPPTSIPSWM